MKCKNFQKSLEKAQKIFQKKHKWKIFYFGIFAKKNNITSNKTRPKDPNKDLSENIYYNNNKKGHYARTYLKLNNI